MNFLVKMVNKKSIFRGICRIYLIFFCVYFSIQTNQIIEIIFAWNPAYRSASRILMFSISDLQIYQLEVKRHTREHDLAAMEQNFCTSVPIFNEDVYTSLSFIWVCIGKFCFWKTWDWTWLNLILLCPLPSCKNQSGIGFLCDHFFGSK